MNAATGNRILSLKGWLGDREYLKSVDEKYIWHVVEQMVFFNNLISTSKKRPRRLSEKNIGGMLNIARARHRTGIYAPQKLKCKKSELGEKLEDTLCRLILDGYDPEVEK